MNVFCLGAEQCDELWDDYAHHIYRLEREDRCCASEVREDLRLKKKQLWGVQEGREILGIVITAIQGSTCEIWAACGSASKDDMRAAHQAIEEWAREINCKRMRIQGRRGWSRLFKEYRQTGVILTKELIDG